MAGKEKQVFKRDLNRLGIFSEMSYLSREIPQHRGHFRNVASGHYMRFGITKRRCGNQDGYFQKPFLRIFEGDCHVGRKITREEREEDAQIEKSIVLFKTTGTSKKHSTPGDFYGTFFTEPLRAMDPQTREKPKQPPSLPNISTRPAKKGGPGYVDITFSKYPQFIPPKEVEEKVRETKKDKDKERLTPFHSGGRTSRFFMENPYKIDNEPRVPLYVRPEKGKTKKQVIREAQLRHTKKEEGEDEKEEKKEKESPPPFHSAGPVKKGVFFSKLTYLIVPAEKEDIAAKVAARRDKQNTASLPEFLPAWCCKPYPQKSIVSHNVDRSINITNWRDFQPFVYA